MGNKGNPGGMAPSGGLRLPTSNAPPNAGPMQPLAQSNIPQGGGFLSTQPNPLIALLAQKGGGGMRPPGMQPGMSPIGTQGGMSGGPMPMAPAAPPLFSTQAMSRQGQPYGYNPVNQSVLDARNNAMAPDQADVMGQRQMILDHMAAARARHPAEQPFDQGGLTPPTTPPVTPHTPTPTFAPIPAQSGWPADLLALLQQRGINIAG